MAEAWIGDWRGRIRGYVRAQGYITLSAFLSDYPGHTYGQLAEILGPDVAPIQIAETARDDAETTMALRAIAQDALVRYLQAHLPQGWGSVDKLTHFNRAHAFAAWASLLNRAKQSRETDGRAQSVWNALEQLAPEPSWQPTSPHDPLIQRAFDLGWPSG